MSIAHMENHLNPRQSAAATAPPGPILIVAGAGTGKTRTLIARIVNFLRAGVPPERICALTFTNKAAQEMLERIGPHMSGKTRPFMGTFHALGAWILRHEAPHVGRTRDFTIFDNSDSFQIVKRILKSRERGEVALTARKKIDKEAPSFFADQISLVKSGSATLKELDDAHRDRRVHDFFDSYETALREHNAFDFDDLIYQVVELFVHDQAVREKYRNRFEHLFVDEYQDINTAQYDLVRLLARDVPSVSVVGDAAQTIYTWRGSRVGIFLNFSKEWPNAQTVFLNENYRSTATIIRAATAIIKKSAEVLLDEGGLITQNVEGDPVLLYEAKDEYSEADWIAQQILRQAQDKFSKSNGLNTGILYRTNAQSRAIEQALLDLNISYTIFGGLKFYERREIKDIVAGIRLIVNPQDSVSRERLEKAFGKRAFAVFYGQLTQTHDIQKPNDAIRLYIEATDYFSYLDRHTDNPAERRENIAELVRFAASFDTIPSFLERISLNGSLDGFDKLTTSEPGIKKSTPVTLMTIHLAKGLEFDHVFLAGVSEGLLPHGRSLGSKSELEEERRLLYVAMTRARKTLALSFFDIPSRFLGDIPEDCLQSANPQKSTRSRNYFDEDFEERFIDL